MRGAAAAVLAVLLLITTSWASCCALMCDLHAADGFGVPCAEAQSDAAAHDASPAPAAAHAAGHSCHLISLGLTQTRPLAGAGVIGPVRFPEINPQFASQDIEPPERPPRQPFGT